MLPIGSISVSALWAEDSRSFRSCYNTEGKKVSMSVEEKGNLIAAFIKNGICCNP